MSFCGKIINQTLLELFEEDNNLYHLGEDILDPYGGAFKITKGLSSKFPNRIRTTPISEAAIVGFSTGMALNGAKPIVEIMFGDFITLAFDQILNHLSKFSQMYENPPKVVIRTPMGGYRGYGPTHSQSLEKFIVGVPGIQIISISDVHDLRSIYRKVILEEKKPTIIIENKSVYSSVYKYRIGEDIDGFKASFTKENYPSAILRFKEYEEYDLSIICYGGLSKVIREILKGRSQSMDEKIQIIDLTNLNKPNFDILKRDISKSKNILILEEGTESFGLSAEYAFRIRKIFSGKIERICARDYFIPSVKNLEEEILPSKDLINRKINEIMRAK